MKSKLLSFSLLLLVLFVANCGGGTGSGNSDVTYVEQIDRSATVFVKLTGTVVKNDSFWKDAMNDVQAAINLASTEGKTHVLIMTGTYKPSSKPNISTGTDNRERHFSLCNNVTVIGGFAGSEKKLEPTGEATVLSGNIDDTPENIDGTDTDITGNSYHVFYHPDTMTTKLDETAVLQNVTITGGNANGDTVIHKNGGGMYNDNSSPKLTGCTFKKNTAIGVSGGASGGGGMCSLNSSPELRDCIFSGNEIDWDGGGLYISNGNPIIANCIFQGNNSKKGSGGGIYIYSGNPKIINCIFEGNKVFVEYYGGGINHRAGNLIIINCTLTGNSSGLFGGGVYSEASHQLTIYGSIIIGNTAKNLSNSDTNYSSTPANYNLIGGATPITDIFVNITESFLIKSDGPAQNKIPLETLKSWYDVDNMSGITDYLGNPRLVGTEGDIGAIELQ